MARNRLAIVFHRFGPYHKARIEAVAREHDVLAIELSKDTSVYSWSQIQLAPNVRRVTISSDRDSRKQSQSFLQSRLFEAFNDFQPSVVAINGWSDNGALAALTLCSRRRIPAVVMSESNQHDFKRSVLGERVKRSLISLFQAGVVGGSLAKEYLQTLGMPADRIFLGYDAVDNAHFARRGDDNPSETRKHLGFPRPYFLVASRLVPKKNLSLVIRAYAEYRREVADAIDLVILGDGPLLAQLENETRMAGVAGFVHFVGFKQYDEIPQYYWGADALVHASTSEQWGLVVNEAMAARLPVIVSNRCGCVPELVRVGENGVSFEPSDVKQLVAAMCAIGRDPVRCRAMGLASEKMIANWSPERFAQAIGQAAAIASQARVSSGLLSSMVLELCKLKG